MDLVERQAEPFCGCGDQIVPDTGARCGTCASLRDDEIERLRMLLAESQAREAKLREALDNVAWHRHPSERPNQLVEKLERIALDGLATPTDHTALREMIAAELEALAKYFDAEHGGSVLAGDEVSELIRARSE